MERLALEKAQTSLRCTNHHPASKRDLIQRGFTVALKIKFQTKKKWQNYVNGGCVASSHFERADYFFLEYK